MEYLGQKTLRLLVLSKDKDKRIGRNIKESSVLPKSLDHILELTAELRSLTSVVIPLLDPIVRKILLIEPSFILLVLVIFNFPIFLEKGPHLRYLIIGACQSLGVLDLGLITGVDLSLVKWLLSFGVHFSGHDGATKGHNLLLHTHYLNYLYQSVR